MLNKKRIENLGFLFFGLGVGFGIISHWVTIGTICFILAGISWIYANVAYKDEVEVRDNASNKSGKAEAQES